jgi:hypothetical protein
MSLTPKPGQRHRMAPCLEGLIAEFCPRGQDGVRKKTGIQGHFLASPYRPRTGNEK